jgi:cytochrome oxidase Cu insertion factor (SCO1/SenC/PrrC family)
MLLILAAMFLVPVIVAFTLYYGKLWRPANSASKGELIDPARPLAVAGLRQTDGTPAGADVLGGKWSLIYIGDGRCDDSCRNALVFGRQSRLALNNEMTRVQRVFLATANCCDNDYLTREHAGLIALDASAPEAQALLAQFPPDREKALFIVDPLGNLMMRHDASHTSKDLLSDLKKLLKLSHIG